MSKTNQTNVLTYAAIDAMTVTELKAECKAQGIHGYSRLSKLALQGLLYDVADEQVKAQCIDNIEWAEQMQEKLAEVCDCGTTEDEAIKSVAIYAEAIEAPSHIISAPEGYCIHIDLSGHRTFVPVKWEITINSESYHFDNVEDAETLKGMSDEMTPEGCKFFEKMCQLDNDGIIEALDSTWDQPEGEIFREYAFDILEGRDGVDYSDSIYCILWNKHHTVSVPATVTISHERQHIDSIGAFVYIESDGTYVYQDMCGYRTYKTLKGLNKYVQSAAKASNRRAPEIVEATTTEAPKVAADAARQPTKSVSAPEATGYTKAEECERVAIITNGEGRTVCVTSLDQFEIDLRFMGITDTRDYGLIPQTENEALRDAIVAKFEAMRGTEPTDPTTAGRITTFDTIAEAIEGVDNLIAWEYADCPDDYDLRAIAEAITCERCGKLAVLPTYNELSDQFDASALWQVVADHYTGDDNPTDPEPTSTAAAEPTTTDDSQPTDPTIAAVNYIFDHRDEFRATHADVIGKFEGLGIDATTAEAMAITLAATSKALADAMRDGIADELATSPEVVPAVMVDSSDETTDNNQPTATNEADDIDVTTPVGWVDHGDETLDVWATTERGTYVITEEGNRFHELGSVSADSDEEAIARTIETWPGGCGFLAINGEQMAYLSNAEFDQRIIYTDQMAEVWRALDLVWASKLRAQLMRNSVVYYTGQLRDATQDEARRDRLRITTSAVTCAIDYLIMQAE